MNVLFVAALPPERSSMVGRIFPLARAVHERGHDVRLLTLSGSTLPPFQTDTARNGVTLRTVGPNIRATGVDAPSVIQTWRRFRAGQSALADALESESADIVILTKPQLQNTAPTLAFARARRTPLLLDADDFEPAASRFPLLMHMHMQGLDQRAARAARVITACSPFLVEYYRRLNPHAQVEFIPTGITVPAGVPPIRLRERLGIAADAKVVLYVGSLSVSSGHRVDLLLEAFAALLEKRSGTFSAHLVLAGDGLDEARLRQRVTRNAELRTRVHFLGRFTPPEDIALAYDADLLVDPVDRTRTAEAKSSHRLMLALAAGTPIITGAVGVRPVLVPQALHALCLYDPARRGDLTAALARGLEPATKDVFRRHTYGLLDQWGWDTLGKRFTELLESLIRRDRLF